MAYQLSVAARNARLDAITTQVGSGAKLRFYTGAAPADCAAAEGGTLLAEMTCGSPFAPGASGGVLTPTTPGATTGSAAGTAAHFRVYNSAGSTCHIQGTVGTSGADCNLNTTTFSVGVNVSVTSWTITEANA